MNTNDEISGCDITRRHALQIAVKGGLVFVAACLSSGEANAASWEQVGKVGQFTVGVPRRVALAKGQIVFVVRPDKTHWLALSARCTHKGGEVHWEAKQRRFVCPLHGATFAATGKDPQGAAGTPLATYPLQLKGAIVQVDSAKASAIPPKRRERDDDDDDR